MPEGLGIGISSFGTNFAKSFLEAKRNKQDEKDRQNEMLVQGLLSLLQDKSKTPNERLDLLDVIGTHLGVKEPLSAQLKSSRLGELYSPDEDSRTSALTSALNPKDLQAASANAPISTENGDSTNVTDTGTTSTILNKLKATLINNKVRKVGDVPIEEAEQYRELQSRIAQMKAEGEINLNNQKQLSEQNSKLDYENRAKFAMQFGYQKQPESYFDENKNQWVERYYNPTAPEGKQVIEIPLPIGEVPEKYKEDELHAKSISKGQLGVLTEAMQKIKNPSAYTSEEVEAAQVYVDNFKSGIASKQANTSRTTATTSGTLPPSIENSINNDRQDMQLAQSTVERHTVALGKYKSAVSDLNSANRDVAELNADIAGINTYLEYHSDELTSKEIAEKNKEKEKLESRLTDANKVVREAKSKKDGAKAEMDAIVNSSKVYGDRINIRKESGDNYDSYDVLEMNPDYTPNSRREKVAPNDKGGKRLKVQRSITASVSETTLNQIMSDNSLSREQAINLIKSQKNANTVNIVH